MSEDLEGLVEELRMLVRPRPPSPWLDAREAAEYLRLSPKTVHNMSAPSAKNPLPCHRLNGGGEKRFHRDELDEWVRGRVDR